MIKIKEQRILRDMMEVNNFDKFIIEFSRHSLWRRVEGELIVDETFKELLDILAQQNLETADNLLKDAKEIDDYGTGNLLGLFSFILNNYLKSGSDNLVNRVIVLCFMLHQLSNKLHMTPYDILVELLSQDLVNIKHNFWTELKYRLGFEKYPCKIMIIPEMMVMISILSGKPMSDVAEYLIDALDIEIK